MRHWNSGRGVSAAGCRKSLACLPKRSPDLYDAVIFATACEPFLPRRRRYISSVSHVPSSIKNYICKMSTVSFKVPTHRQLHSDVERQVHRAYIALGSNLGDRVEMIEKA